MEVFHVSLSQLLSLHLHFQGQQWKHQKNVKFVQSYKKMFQNMSMTSYLALIYNFEQISHILVFTHLTLNKKLLAEWLHIFQTITTLDSFWKYHHKSHFYIKSSGMTTGFQLRISRIQKQFNLLLLIRDINLAKNSDNQAPCNFIKKETLAQVFSCEFCEISKNTFFTEHLWKTASMSAKDCKANWE